MVVLLLSITTATTSGVNNNNNNNFIYRAPVCRGTSVVLCSVWPMCSQLARLQGYKIINCR